MGYIDVEPVTKASRVRTYGTTQSVTTSISVPGGFTPDNIEVFLDGLYLQPTDYDDSSGSNLVFPQTIPSGTDYIVMEARNFVVADHYTKSESDSRYPLKSDGVSGTFTTNDGKTVTVTDGIITGIV